MKGVPYGRGNILSARCVPASKNMAVRAYQVHGARCRPVEGAESARMVPALITMGLIPMRAHHNELER